ncbi:unnamed protein product [Rotaria sordida]|uniref:F-box domain-containing protein n=1 Tax=Rotaria sordida TaxID=392033 RepID=A0A815BCY6_9BILA|nr:unnamed protein product [Rotaria sordida]CAF4045303.1 unnamed protein product [Rotaria sordida]
MSNELKSSLETLPIELIYRIFDNLNLETILSFRYVCQRFYSITNTYNRYKFDLKLISKYHFDLICRIIHPENVISLTLSDDDMTPGQISSFISRFSIDQFNRLRTLTLCKITEQDLNKFLKHMTISSLTSLIIEQRDCYTSANSQLTMSILSHTMTQSNLCKLELDMRSYCTDEILWPSQFSIKYLTISNCNFNQIIIILRHSSHLQSFIVKNCIIHNLTKTISISSDLKPLKQLTSMIFEDSELSMDTLGWFLSSIPSLIYLKLEGRPFMYDSIFGQIRLENFIQTKLHHLEKFEFFFRFVYSEVIQNRSTSIETRLEQFRTPFWLENKRCFVNCDYIKSSGEILLYSIPICNHRFEYYDDSNKISSSTSSTIYNDSIIMDNVRELDLHLKNITSTSMIKKNVQPMFRKLTKLKLIISDDWSLDSFQFVSTLIDLSHLVKIILIISSRGDFLQEMILNFFDLMKQARNVCSLEIFNRWHGISYFMNIENFCSIIPQHIKHLDIDIVNINDMKVILERLEQLSSVKFKFSFEKWIFAKEILEWISQKRNNSTHLKEMHYLSLWIGKKKNILPSRMTSHKRIKLTH